MPLTAEPERTRQPAGLVLKSECDASRLRGGAVRTFRSFDAALAWLDEAVASGEPPRPSISSR